MAAAVTNGVAEGIAGVASRSRVMVVTARVKVVAVGAGVVMAETEAAKSAAA